MPDKSIRKAIAEAEAQVQEPASLEQREVGNYQKGHFTWCGLGITLETAKGTTRRGTDPSGHKWSITLKNSYGYIKGTDSAEPGDEMDVFVGDEPETELVFVVDQNRNGQDKFDEHKCVIGCSSSAAARSVYESNYSPGWKGFRSVTPLTVPQFKEWLERGDMTKPLKGQKFETFCKVALVAVTNKKKKDWRRRLGAAVPWVAGGAIGGGFLSELLRRGAFTPDVLDTMRDFSRKSELDRTFQPHAHLPHEEQAMHRMADYAIQGNKLLQHKFWGLVSPTQLIKALRSGSLVADKDKWTPGSSAHYQAFEDGPLSGLVRVLGELTQNGWQPVDGADPIPKLPDQVRDKLRDTVNNLTGKQIVDSVGGNPGTAWHFPAISSVAGVPQDEQLRIMRKLPAALKEALPEDLWKQFGSNVSRGRDVVYQGYGKLTDGLYKTNDAWRHLNTALMATGLLGATAYGVNNWLQPKRRAPSSSDKPEEEQKKASFLGTLAKGVRHAAGVPKGQAFAPTLGAGAKNVLKLGFNPELGRVGNVGKRLAQGAGLYGLFSGVKALEGGVKDVAGEAARFVPDTGKLAPTNQWLESMRDSPWSTGLATALQGFPRDMSEGQQALIKSITELGARAKLHDTHLPSWKDMAQSFHSPAMPPTQSLLQQLVSYLVRPPQGRDYNQVAGNLLRVAGESE